MGSPLSQALPRLLPPVEGTLVSGRGPSATPDPSAFFLADTGGHAQRYVVWKGRPGPSALWWPGKGWQARGCLQGVTVAD